MYSHGCCLLCGSPATRSIPHQSRVSAPSTDFNSLVQLLISISRQHLRAILDFNIWTDAVSFEALPLRCKPSENWNSEPVSATHLEVRGTENIAARLSPCRQPFSAVNFASISAALFVHSLIMIMITIRP